MVRTFHWCLALICVILIGSEHRAKTRLIQAPEFSVTVRKIWSTYSSCDERTLSVGPCHSSGPSCSKGGYRETSLKGSLQLFFNHFLWPQLRGDTCSWSLQLFSHILWLCIWRTAADTSLKWTPLSLSFFGHFVLLCIRRTPPSSLPLSYFSHFLWLSWKAVLKCRSQGCSSQREFIVMSSLYLP